MKAKLRSNYFSGEVTDEVKVRANQIIDYLDLEGFAIQYDITKKALVFERDFRILTIPVKLIVDQKWSDIRHLYRAVCLPGPQVENFGAENEWSRNGD